MQWHSLNLFAYPLIKIPMKSYPTAARFFNQKLRQTGDNNVISHYHSRQNVFEIYEELAEVGAEIQQAGSFAYKQLLNHQKSGDMRINGAWFNLCQPGGDQMKHSHGNCLLSGTLYLNTDEHSEITFYHPLSADAFHAELNDEPCQSNNAFGLNYHVREVSVAVSAGDCLFWPPQLKHGYKANKTPDRLSLSFNLMPHHLNSIYQL